VRIHLSILPIALRRHLGHVEFRSDRGQATSEYALVLLGAAAVALMLLAWAAQTDRIGVLMDFVLDEVIGRVR